MRNRALTRKLARCAEDEAVIALERANAAGAAASSAGFIKNLDTTSFPGPNLLAAVQGSVAFPANSISAFSSGVRGVFTGLASQVAITGPQVVAFTAAGGRPRVGQTAYLAAYTDDGNTAAGKATAVCPTNGFGFDSSLEQNRVPVGVVLDNSQYVALGTCVVDFAPAAADALAPPQSPDEIYLGQETIFPTNADFLSLDLTVAGNRTFATLGVGESMIICWRVLDSSFFIGGNIYFVMGATNPGFTEGWYLDEFLGSYFFAINTAGGAQSVQLAYGRQMGMDCVAATVTPNDANGQLRVCHRGGQIQFADLPGAPVAPSAASSFRVGGPLAGQQGWNGQSVVYAVKVQGNLTDGELSAAARQFIPSPPRNRFVPVQGIGPQFASDYTGIRGDVQYAWVSAFGNNTLAFAPVGAAAPFAWAVNGAPVGQALSQQWYRTPQNFLVDTSTPFRNTHGGIEAASFARLLPFTVTVAQGEVGVGSINEDGFNDHALIGVSIAGGAINPEPGTGPTPMLQYQWFLPTTSPLGSYVTAIQYGEQQQYVGFLNPGAVVDGFVGPVGLVPGTPAVNKRLVLAASTDAVPPDAVTQAVTNGFVTLCRSDFPSAGGPGGVTCVGGATLQATEQIAAGGGSAKPWAALIADAAAEGAPTTVVVAVGLGMSFEAWRGLSGFTPTPAQFAADFGALADALHAQVPAGNPSATVFFYAVKSIQAWADAVANGIGHTLSEYDAEIDAVGAARPWLHVVSVRAPNPITFIGGPGPLPAGVSTNDAGAAALHLNFKAALAPNY